MTMQIDAHSLEQLLSAVGNELHRIKTACEARLARNNELHMQAIRTHGADNAWHAVAGAETVALHRQFVSFMLRLAEDNPEHIREQA